MCRRRADAQTMKAIPRRARSQKRRWDWCVTYWPACNSVSLSSRHACVCDPSQCCGYVRALRRRRRGLGRACASRSFRLCGRPVVTLAIPPSSGVSAAAFFCCAEGELSSGDLGNVLHKPDLSSRSLQRDFGKADCHCRTKPRENAPHSHCKGEVGCR